MERLSSIQLNNPIHQVSIGLVGRYVEVKDAYKSISEAFIHAGASVQCKVKLKLIHSELLEKGKRILQRRVKQFRW